MHGKFARRDVFHFCPILPALVVSTLLALFPCAAAAQTQAQPHMQLKDGTVKISAWTTGAMLLSHGWRFHRGDNPAYARPDFNDSSWQTVTVNSFRNGQAGASWYRLKVEIPSGNDPLALNVIGLKGAYQVYVNGALVPGARRLPVLQDRYPGRVMHSHWPSDA